MLVKGSIVAIVTPMKANGDLDLNALDKLVDFHIESGTKELLRLVQQANLLLWKFQNIFRLLKE